MLVWAGIAGGLVLLVGGGELLVRGASRVATIFGLSPLVIGLTIVAFGTSAPELAVSLQAVHAGAADVAVGNVIGSNIFNVLFILGVSALLTPLTVTRRIVRVEVPIMIGISVLTLVAALDGRLGRIDGLILLLVAMTYTGWLLRNGAGELPNGGGAHQEPAGPGALAAVLTAAAGLALLVAGARFLVQGAVALAQAYGVSDAVIGLTIVAAGTSLPEVAASVAAALHGQRDIAIGNVVGSNIFNLAVILGLTALTADGVAVAPGLLRFDAVVMLAVAVACLPIFFTGHAIARWEGGLFLGYYAAYTLYLVLDATGHDYLAPFRDAMLYFAVPLTAVTLAVLWAQAAVQHRRGGSSASRQG